MAVAFPANFTFPINDPIERVKFVDLQLETCEYFIQSIENDPQHASFVAYWKNRKLALQNEKSDLLQRIDQAASALSSASSSSRTRKRGRDDSDEKSNRSHKAPKTEAELDATVARPVNENSTLNADRHPVNCNDPVCVWKRNVGAAYCAIM